MENRVEAENIVDVKKQAKRQIGLKNKVLFTILSLVSVVAILSVGVYASVNSFAVNLDNSITVEVRNVSGVLWAQRTGGVLAEFDENGKTKKATSASAEAPFFEDVLYDINDGGVKAENINELQSTKVNLSREHNSITYVFRYTAYSGTVKIKVQPVATGKDADKLNINQKFCYAKSMPNWEAQGYTFNNSHELKVSSGAQNTIFIYVNLSIDTENASYSISDLDFEMNISVESMEH